MYKENFPERIKKARIDAGYTQPQVAKETMISKGTISKYETGKLEPDLEKLAVLADFYCVSIDWMLGLGQREYAQKEPPRASKPHPIDKVVSAASLYAFLATLSWRDKKVFLSGKMKFSQFTESDYFRRLSPEQQIYLYQEYEKQQWEQEQGQGEIEHLQQPGEIQRPAET